MAGNTSSSDDITRRFEAMEQRINILQRENEALQSQVRSTASIATGSRFQYRRDTSGLNRRLDLDAAPDHPLHVPFGEPGGPVLQQIREFDPLPNHPRSNPSWLPPPPTQPFSAGTSTTTVTTTAARVIPSQAGTTTSAMMSIPTSAPASRPLPPPMVTMSMPLPVSLPTPGLAPVAQMQRDQILSQQVVQPVVNVVASAPGTLPQLMTAPPASQAPQTVLPSALMRPDSSRNYSPYTPLNRYPRDSRNAPIYAASGTAVYSPPASWRIPPKYLLSASPRQSNEPPFKDGESSAMAAKV
ncbi:proline-rich receptor-like protein kinase PERK10 [Spinacia oleracea]|uniref:Proline-rich receptor-like protein kinase PERK10 n=1 Tax=Spinacia oleracea TaxID=3562 RepID=A0ABM3RPF6_SPIOL|nr:proline-rich receptor-like protein kinase PERK10 [Spinacia oleracea]